MELFDKPVPFPYGKPEGVQHPDYVDGSTMPYTYNPLDHCQFDRYQEVATTCMPVGNETKNAMKECVDLMERDFGSGKWRTGSISRSNQKTGFDGAFVNNFDYDEGTDPGTYRSFESRDALWYWDMGIEGTLMQNPTNTIENVEPHIPWDDSTCAVQSPLLTLNGSLDIVAVRRSDALTEANIRSVSMFRGIVESKDKECTDLHRTYSGFPQLNEYVAKMTLRNAMAKCAEMMEACQGVQVAFLETTSREEIGRNERALISVSFCKLSTIRPSTAGRITFIKNKQHLHHLNQYTVPQTTSPSPTDNVQQPSFPGDRKGSGIGHEQLLKVGKTIKINFMPAERAPTCREVYLTTDMNPLECYWCYRTGWRSVIDTTRPDLEVCDNDENLLGRASSLSHPDNWFIGNPCEMYCDTYPNMLLNKSNFHPDYWVSEEEYVYMNNSAYNSETGEYACSKDSNGKCLYGNDALYAYFQAKTSLHYGFEEKYPNLKVNEDGTNNGNFDIASISSLIPKDWAVDNGQTYGPKVQRSNYNGVQNLEYGWNCDVSNDIWVGETGWLNPDNIMNVTHIKFLDSPCKNQPGKAKSWRIKLPEGPGLYRVYIYAGQHQEYPSRAQTGPAKGRSHASGGVHGCTIENVRMGVSWTNPEFANQMLSHGIIEKIVFTKDEFLTFEGGKYCMVINWIMFEKVSSTEATLNECKMARGSPTDMNSDNSHKVINSGSTEENCILKVKNWSVDFPNDPRSPIGALRRSSNGQCFALFELGQLKDDLGWTTCKFGGLLTPAVISSFEPVWLPSSKTESGIVWEMELTNSGEDIGFVTAFPQGSKSVGGNDIGFGDWSCRSRWLWDGDYCQEKSPINTGPYYTADSEICSLATVTGHPWLKDLPPSKYPGQSCRDRITYPRWNSNLMFTTTDPLNATGTYTWNQDLDLHGGTYGDDQGLIVSVADEPCDFTDPENPICPEPKKVCGHPKRPTMCPFRDASYCPINVNCNGVRGRYVRVQLPGTHRIMDTKIQVHLHRPKVSDSTKAKMICYGVHSSPATSISKSYSETKDMEDPKFYSSCYVREKFRSMWKSLSGQTFPPEDYVYGNQCIDCKSYQDGAATLNAGALLGERVNRWLPAPDCVECAHPLLPSNAGGTGTGGTGTGGTGTGGTGNGCPPASSPTGSAVEFQSQDRVMNVQIHHHPGSEPSKNFLDFTVTVNDPTIAWFAVGVSETGSMTNGMAGGSDIFSCELDAGPMRYWATSRSSNWVNKGIALKGSAPQDETFVEDPKNEASCEFVNGVGTLNFRRLLTVEEGSSDQREIKVGELTHFIWAYGTSTTIGYHGTDYKGKQSIVIPEFQNINGCNGAGTTTTTAPSPAATEPSPATAPSPATEPSPASTHCSAGQKVAITISSDTATKQQSANATAVADKAKLEAERIAAEATAALAAQTLADEAGKYLLLFIFFSVIF